jgi:hypothetical protein
VKRRVKLYGLVALVLLAVAGVMTYGNAELSTLVWHLRHGFHAEIGGIRVRVPLAYEADDPHGLSSLSITRLPSRLWRKGGFIIIDFQKLPSPEAMESADALLRKSDPGTGMKRIRVGERTAIFAGRQGTCVEYNAETVRPPVSGYEIQCRFGADVSVELIGSPDLKNDFYEMIRTAEAVRRKN